jgi:hypothetical protein
VLPGRLHYAEDHLAENISQLRHDLAVRFPGIVSFRRGAWPPGDLAVLELVLYLARRAAAEQEVCGVTGLLLAARARVQDG